MFFPPGFIYIILKKYININIYIIIYFQHESLVDSVSSSQTRWLNRFHFWPLKPKKSNMGFCRAFSRSRLHPQKRFLFLATVNNSKHQGLNPPSICEIWRKNGIAIVRWMFFLIHLNTVYGSGIRGSPVEVVRIDQWLFLVPLKGGRWHIIPQLAVYTTYIPLIYCLLGGYMLPTSF